MAAMVGSVHVVGHRVGRVGLLLEREGDDAGLAVGVGRLQLALLLHLEPGRVVGLEAGPEGGVVGDLVGVVDVLGVGRRAAGLTEEREVRRPRRVRRGQERAPEGDDHEDLVAVVADVVDDLVLREEAGEREDAGEGEARR